MPLLLCILLEETPSSSWQDAADCFRGDRVGNGQVRGFGDFRDVSACQNLDG